MTWSIFSSRSLDMPTVRGAFMGRPPPDMTARETTGISRDSTDGLGRRAKKTLWLPLLGRETSASNQRPESVLL
jgi:hypothetical protein